MNTDQRIQFIDLRHGGTFHLAFDAARQHSGEGSRQHESGARAAVCALICCVMTLAL